MKELSNFNGRVGYMLIYNQPLDWVHDKFRIVIQPQNI